MKIDLRYGRDGYELHLPDEWDVRVLRKPPLPVLDDPLHALEQSLEQPDGGEPLSAAARGCSSACILVCDITRPVPNGLILPLLIRRLLDYGMALERITILIATGLHRPNLGAELAELINDPWVLEHVRIVNHDARDHEQHTDLGATDAGTPIMLDKRLVEADLRIAVGLVEPHFMAGYSGGRKLVAPGVAHERTITRLHSAQLLEDPRVTNCNINDNPLHGEQLQIVRKLAPLYAINTVLDEERRVCLLNFGEVERSHARAVEFVRAHAELLIHERFANVVTTAAGHPLDATYYQAVKAMVGASDAVQPGGALFVAAACSEGLGSPEYCQAQQRLIDLGPDEFLARLLDKRNAAVDEWQTQMQLRATRRFGVHLFSQGLSALQRSLTGVQVVDSLERALWRSVEQSGDSRLAVIPEGPYLIPKYELADGVNSVS
ncbi:MAG: nickel-dependent lactate racemase [Candidatus Alcyoniella australis]|nr:nickel-dependent lactate racemase [Candidatus Alcyoniella australis]